MSDSNGSIKMVETVNKGRSLVSCRPLKAGEIILKDSPILLYSAVPHAAANYCSHCFRTIPNSPHSPAKFHCPNCTTATIFCSQNCQSIALSTSHTPFVCQSLTLLRTFDSLPHDHLLQARFLISAYNLAMVSPSNFQTLLSLQGQSFPDEASVSFLHAFISSVPNVGSLGFSVELTSALLAKDKLNAFGLMEPFDQSKEERSVRAYGIYPRASFFNHDCLPNACRFDYVDSMVECGGNTDIVVRVIHDLPEGREICLSYFPVNLKYSERQTRLKEDYGFTCDCDRCKVEAIWSDSEKEGEEEMEMDEDEDEDEDEDGDDGMWPNPETDDFPHAYFFASYMCNKENCWGTLAPLPPSDARPSTVMECNLCGHLSKCEDLVDGNGKLQ